MPRSLKVLVVEDNADDAELLLRNLTRSGFNPDSIIVDTEDGYLTALERPLDIILSDFEMPNFSGMRALKLLQKSGKNIPFIIVSGSIGEDVAVASMRQGATDYLIKDRMARLGSAVEQALEQNKLRLTSTRAMQALRESEERFREVVETINEVFWMTDPKRHEMLYISPAYETIWGRPCSDIMSHPSDWLKAIHEDDRPRIAAAAVRQMNGDYDEIYRVVRPDGSIRWVRERAFPIRDAARNVYRIVGTAEDITEQRRLEEQFLQSQKMEAIGTLAGGIAHDFNNILAAIMGYAELIQLQTNDQPQVNGYIQALLQAGSRATSLVRQILTFSRQGEHERKPVQLSQVVSEPLGLLRATIPASIMFDVKLDENLPPVLADATQIHQIVMNIGTNAAHAMDNQAGRLTVRLEPFEVTTAHSKKFSRLKPGQHLRLSVSDTGRGMSAEVMERMFEPFYTTKAPGEGTGLGLAVVHGIMQTHDGEVAVRSTPGVGTTFELYFPAHALPAKTDHGHAEGNLPRGHGERVLFVDDETPIMLVGQLILAELGYRVEAGTSALEMLELLKSQPDGFDLVITDLTMPDMTGVEFSERIRVLRPDMPIILTTGYSATLTPQRVQQLGISELLIKPLSMQSLATAIQRALN
ncbi:MAG: response regulator [Opitutaceae bacterium]|jgi:PAS domain S-box-containing protein